MKISVAMATFNGAHFLREQLESLADQSHLPDELVVGDDGSTDETLGILEEFRNHSPFPVHIHSNETNLGYARNFLATAQRCRADWVAFCDQDDVWLPNKLADVVISTERKPGCCMVLQNAWLCDGALASRNRKFPNRLRPGLHGACEQYGFWVWPGFLKTIRSDMIKLLGDEEMPRSWSPSDRQLTHDKWTCMIANALGGVVVLDEPAALYRRHEAALTGDYNGKTFSERVKMARSVSADHYEFLADVAEDCAVYMNRLSECTNDPEWASALHENSCNFISLQKTQRLRARLYSNRRFVDRLLSFWSLLREGGYFGVPFTAMGARSAAKDAMRVVLGKT